MFFFIFCSIIFTFRKYIGDEMKTTTKFNDINKSALKFPIHTHTHTLTSEIYVSKKE